MDSGQAKGSHMLIEAAYGLGMWGGAVKITPNRYVIHRTHATIVDEQVAPQPVALVSDDKSPGTYRIELPSAQASRRVLTDSEIQQLHQLALKVESHFGSPQMVEWAMAGGQIYLLQSRSLQ
jgi:pyruvate, water dikinase